MLWNMREPYDGFYYEEPIEKTIKRNGLLEDFQIVIEERDNKDITLGTYLQVFSSEERKSALKKLIDLGLHRRFYEKIEALLFESNSFSPEKLMSKTFTKQTKKGEVILPENSRKLLSDVHKISKKIRNILRFDSEEMMF